MLKQLSLTEAAALLVCALLVVSCGNNQGVAKGASGTSANVLSSTAGSLSSGTGPSSSSGQSLLIQSFSPASGSTLQTLPTTVQAYFNESSLSTTVTNAGNWIVSCASCGWYAQATTVSFTAGTATVTLPTPPQQCRASGGSCTLQAANTIQDNAGHALGGSTSASYTIRASAAATFQVSSFAPASGATMPTSVKVTFSTSNLSASTIQNTANWSLYCGNGGYQTIPAIVYNNDSTATVTMPSGITNLPSGTQCTLSVLSTLTDTFNDALIPSQAVYNITTSTAPPTQVGTAGGNGGSAFTPISGPSGTRLVGMTVIASSDYVTQIQPEWSTNTGNYSWSGVIGPSNPSTLTTNSINCSIGYGYRASGIFGNLTQNGCGSGGSQPCIYSVGLICSMEPSSAYYYPGIQPYNTYTEGSWEATMGASYNLTCPPGTFITQLYGRSGSGVDQLGISCQ